MDVSDIRILSAASALPGDPVDNAALARRFGMDKLWEQWVDAFVGTKTRHLSLDLDSGKTLHSLADLAETAGRRALAAAGVEPADVDVMVLGTATPDLLMPATVNQVADRLGINDIPTYQLQSGCAGAVQALDVARKLLAVGGDGPRTALVLGGDVCAKHLDLQADLTALAPAELVNVLLFGDGAGAVVLSTEPRPQSTALRHVVNVLTGLGRDPGQVVEWYGMADRGAGHSAVREDYKAIEERVPLMAGEVLETVLGDLGWDREDVDYLLPPQLSGKMTSGIMTHLDVPGVEEVSCVTETGNNGNALPFLQLERTLPQLVTGDRAVAIAIESSKWIKAGFALERC
ncbi:3-oxoacyl-ACP synthase [Streptomyces sp. 3MP-14]|uniref:3-oxoacyl-ACP synthase n=1 Tax=Streptomyces mimosae TaxID=2586635 RepID=A0A5N5ZSV4_9ACTN|nr:MULTISPECIES: 3-oxoacyl-ACP synthase III family protein [Streptomyces]KAB8159584.1 3-oxoacyl-ACP synthase [Streptomyces mimosae]KAB8172862.1 3-oxoacyl-ACP synthase [Streptomyces sp. 3MP-14]